MVDGFVLREMHRRCNYSMDAVLAAQEALLVELDMRLDGLTDQVEGATGKLGYYLDQYNRSSMASVVILPYIWDGYSTQYLSTKHIEQLVAIVEGMLAYVPFELVTIHDDFKSHPNNCNHVRNNYKEILAQIAESHLLDDLLSQLYGVKGTFTKLSNNLGDLIRKSNYGLS